MTPSQWHWQEPGTAWRGCGIYHITLAQSDRSIPLLGQLTECADPADAEVERTELGNAIVHCVAQIPQHHPEIKLLQYTLMPDHIHFIVHVTRQMQMGIMTAVRGFWQGTKAAYRLWRSSGQHVVSFTPDTIWQNERKNPLPDNLFHKMPYVVPLAGKGQLERMIRYVQDNPRRAMLKRLNRDLFKMRREICIERDGVKLIFSAMGNMFLLDWPLKQQVECSRTIRAEELTARRLQVLRNAELGYVTITAAINDAERSIAKAVREAGYPLVILLKDGFPVLNTEQEKYYKPGGIYFDTCAAGKLLLLEPVETTFVNPVVYHLTQEDLRRKADVRHWTYTPLPTTCNRYRFVALNNIGRLL